MAEAPERTALCVRRCPARRSDDAHREDDGALLAVLHDVAYDFRYDPSEIATLWVSAWIGSWWSPRGSRRCAPSTGCGAPSPGVSRSARAWSCWSASCVRRRRPGRHRRPSDLGSGSDRGSATGRSTADQARHARGANGACWYACSPCSRQSLLRCPDAASSCPTPRRSFAWCCRTSAACRSASSCCRRYWRRCTPNARAAACSCRPCSPCWRCRSTSAARLFGMNVGESPGRGPRTVLDRGRRAGGGDTGHHLVGLPSRPGDLGRLISTPVARA